ncbi:MAG TPA: electron transport complex subunit RsxC [Gammaproteobacteria bacterium]|nr:electron transport complex subunit RsxC [Gammaproteobacteria bacterium]
MTESIPANIETRRGRATRGITLDSHKSASTQLPLAPAPIPSEIIVPLEGGLSARDLRPAVHTGQRVLRGQPLVQGGGPLSTWTHASTSGVVRSLERRRIAHPRRREALCAVIDVDGKDEIWPELARPDPTHWDTPEKLGAALSRAGLSGLAGAVFPTGLKLTAAWRRRMRLVIVNGMECEPYISCDDMLMRTSPRDVLAGALALVELAGADHGVVAIEEDKPEALRALQHELPTLDTLQRLSIVTVRTMYPGGGERQLIQALTGEEVPSLAKPTDVGYLCQNVGTAAALFRYLARGEPVTSRVTTVTGGAIATPRNLEVRLGTRIADLVAACGGYTGKVARLIMGGSMMGHALDNDLMPVGRPTNCIVAATAAELREDSAELPCIRCGNCADVCPAYLQPQELNAAAEHDEFDILENLGLFDCIECGCCDVVCPSHIPLTETFRVGKRRLVQAMSHDARVRWLDGREQLRRQRVETWDREHGEDADKERPQRRRLEGIAEIIARASRAPETTQVGKGE